MAAKSKSDRPVKVPAYSHHKASGQAVVRLNGRDRYLGPYGSPESHERYAQEIAHWRAGRLPSPSRRNASSPLSVNEMLLAYTQFAYGYYTHEGQPNQEYDLLRYAMRRVKALFGHSRAADFGPKDLKALQQRLVDEKLSRTYINGQIGRVKRIFKWAVSEELVPPSVYHGLQTVTGLRFGRTEARETEPIRPVADSHVEAILPFVAPPVAALIRLQRLTGMRSGELVIMRACDIDMSGEVWLYTPSNHKNKWRGQPKVVPLGPQAQLIVKEFLKLDTTAFLFSPQEAEAWHKARHSTATGKSRKTLVYPCEIRRRELVKKQRASRKRRRAPRDRYDTGSYRQAIQYGIERAQESGRNVPNWHPHQLRHAKVAFPHSMIQCL